MSARKCLLAGDDAGPRGYALYRTKPDWDDDGLPYGGLSVRELIATDAEAAAALWTDLLTRDLVGEVAARGGRSTTRCWTCSPTGAGRAPT